MAKKKRTITSYKKAAWMQFSRYIRMRDCLLTTGTKEFGKCITCKRRWEFNKLQAGHFLSGRGATILFHEEMVNAQCYQCNVTRYGNLEEYYPIMLEKYGQEQIDEWKVLKKQTHEWTADELIALRKKYKEEYEFIRDNN